MDSVRDEEPRLSALEDLGLMDEDVKLLRQIEGRYSTNSIKYLLIERGLSSAVKVALKPQRLFPLLVKIDAKWRVAAEHAGDQKIRCRIPPLSAPPLEDMVEADSRAAIAYRYVTGGRVRDLVGRLDEFLGRCSVGTGQAVIGELFDIVLKKCHWLDGDFELRPLRFEPIKREAGVADDEWGPLKEAFDRHVARLSDAKVPHGIIHGDLHPKNVLVTRHGAPVLIDFARVASDRCVFLDYARLETHLQFQVPGMEKFWDIHRRLYSTDPMILPRSEQPLATYVHTVRSILWRNAMSKTVGLSDTLIDDVYRACVAWHLLRVVAKPSIRESDSRTRAAEEIRCLYGLPEAQP